MLETCADNRKNGSAFLGSWRNCTCALNAGRLGKFIFYVPILQLSFSQTAAQARPSPQALLLLRLLSAGENGRHIARALADIQLATLGVACRQCLSTLATAADEHRRGSGRRLR